MFGRAFWHYTVQSTHPPLIYYGVSIHSDRLTSTAWPRGSKSPNDDGDEERGER